MKIYQVVGLLLVLILMSGCKSSPIYNINYGPIPINTKIQTIEETLTKALYSKGWKVVSKKNGEIIAKITPRQHSATISITYDDTRYSIRYVNSSNLKYDAQDQSIHRNYNKWIILLEQRIEQFFNNPDAMVY